MKEFILNALGVRESDAAAAANPQNPKKTVVKRVERQLAKRTTAQALSSISNDKIVEAAKCDFHTDTN